MDYQVFDYVKYEKARAMEHFNRSRKMMKMLQIVQVIVAFMLISWSWTRLPTSVKLSGDLLLVLSIYLFNPHVVFLIGNAIIVVIVLLCRQTEANSNSVTANFNHEDVRSGDDQQPIVTEVPVSAPASPPEMAEPTFTGGENKQIVFSESNDVDEETGTKKIQILQRTKSEKLKRETAVPQTKLRRTKTDMDSIVVRPGQTTAVDTLSNEEFRLTIEAFIKKNQIFFETQRLAETEQATYVN